MANTREVLGDQETLDALISGELKEFEESGISSLNGYEFQSNESLEKITLPSVTVVNGQPLTACKSLKTVDFAGNQRVSFKSNCFAGSRQLQHLILRCETAVADSTNNSLLNSTEIASLGGAIYVPEGIVDLYKSNSYWKQFLIKPLSKYPIDFDSSISDSWEEILEAEDDGTYLDKYQIGDTKSYNDGTNIISMQIVAFDSDDLADGTGKAHITWVEKYITYTCRYYETYSGGGFQGSDLDVFMNETEFAKMPIALQNGIKTVKKPTCIIVNNVNTTVDVDAKIFPLSSREVYGTSGSIRETTGPIYSGLFSVNNYENRKKMQNGDVSNWWLRSEASNFRFSYSSKTNSLSFDMYSTEKGVIRGFCT